MLISNRICILFIQIESNQAIHIIAATEQEPKLSVTWVDGSEEKSKSKVKVKFICIANFMYRTIQSALHKIKALQLGAEQALKYVKEYKLKEIK